MSRRASPQRRGTATPVRRFALVAAAALALATLVAPSAAAYCGKTYSYAGVVSARPGYGVATTLTALAVPSVAWGHVAGWVGVGGRGAGANGETAWLQVGYSGFYGGESKLYYEATLPRRSPRYTEVDPHVRPGESHRIAVVEVRGRRDFWRVWVDRRPVSEPFYLPGSHGRWRPMAMAESWNAGMGACNRLAYRFSRLMVAASPGGRWRRFRAAYELEDPGYQVRRTRAGFIALARP